MPPLVQCGSVGSTGLDGTDADLRVRVVGIEDWRAFWAVAEHVG